MSRQAVLSIAIAVIKKSDESTKYLITRRAMDKELAGLWEFPGGKVEESESIYDALVREIKEEVGLQIQHATPMTVITHTYPTKTVALHVFLVEQFTGTASCLESQLEMDWVSAERMQDLEFPEANYEIIQQLICLNHNDHLIQ